ncbi:PREDICTED: uncharacterized protein LOC104812645 isoform X2 [Tarenaya hassleriana]|uniref:uncharacterized protein LOC104812645 isoform X2 n=1 Tax=Tarenaya hassleriana TaxID=28532 RepID=UPI00053C6805|nr:PREDICTED: uncharacterized protein LOC104812645 isoform X2 [Tarenaya hassleriana]
MSGKVGGGGSGSFGARKSHNGISDIPSGSRKIVQSLKEIVNCPEAEIYAMLKECNMDPNEAVNRILSQDPFHEVKSKKDKKKENKDTTDSRSRGVNNNYNHGVRGGSDHYAGRGSAAPFSSTESGSFQRKSTNRRENGRQGYVGSASSGVVGRNQPSHSDFVAIENKMPSVSLGDGKQPSQSASGHQPAWFGAAGQMSMADIVKMGRPLNKIMNPWQNVEMRPKLDSEHEVANQHVLFKDDWPLDEKPVAASTSAVSKAHAESEICSDPSDFQSGRRGQQHKAQFEEVHRAENGSRGNLGIDQLQPGSVSGRNVLDNDSAVSTEFDDNQYKHETQNHPVEHEKDEDDTSSVAGNLQELSIENHDHEEEDKPGVIIPDHLQVHAPDCSQLSFGSFGGFGSKPLSNNLEEEAPDVAPEIKHSDARNTEFYGDEHLASANNGNIVHVSNPSTEDYDTSDSQREISRQENPETAQYTFAQSEPGYAYENVKQQTNTTFDESQTSTQMPNLTSLSNVMQGYTNPIPNTLLAQPEQSVRELELQYSPFSVAQSMPLRNSNNPSSLNAQSISVSEALRGGSISTAQSAQQALPGANIATGPALPQQLPMHPYAQPSLPLTHFPNMIGYPLLPQSYPYIPSAFMQAFAGNNSSYHQSLAALHPQYKNSVSTSSLPQPGAASASAYGFGNSSNVGAGNYPLNQSAGPTGTSLGYEEALSSQYKESNHMLSLQQHQQNSPMWLHNGHGSRTMSTVPTNGYYNLQPQQQGPEFRHSQPQASQHYGSLGYPNFYHPQTGISIEHHPPQNPRDGGPPSKQQIWQNPYHHQ